MNSTNATNPPVLGLIFHHHKERCMASSANITSLFCSAQLRFSKITAGDSSLDGCNKI